MLVYFPSNTDLNDKTGFSSPFSKNKAAPMSNRVLANCDMVWLIYIGTTALYIRLGHYLQDLQVCFWGFAKDLWGGQNGGSRL